MIRDDVAAALVILDHLRHQIDVHRLACLRAGQAAGMSYADLAPLLGVGTRQGAELAVRRLESAAAGGPKDEKAERDSRRRTSVERRRVEIDSSRIHAFAVLLVENRDRLGPVADDVDDIASELAIIPRGGEVSPGFVARLRLVLRELRQTGWPIPADLVDAFAAGEQLVSANPAQPNG